MPCSFFLVLVPVGQGREHGALVVVVRVVDDGGGAGFAGGVCVFGGVSVFGQTRMEAGEVFVFGDGEVFVRVGKVVKPFLERADASSLVGGLGVGGPFDGSSREPGAFGVDGC